MVDPWAEFLERVPATGPAEALDAAVTDYLPARSLVETCDLLVKLDCIVESINF